VAVHGSQQPCWVHLDETVRKQVDWGGLGMGLAHVRQDKLVGDGSAAGECSPVLTVGHAVTFVDQDHVKKQELGDYSRWERKPWAGRQPAGGSSPRL
jgi:hypothetical protein